MFLITRFTHGSAGKFLSTILQTSTKVDHWSAILQANKSNLNLFESLSREYVKRSFPVDHSKHMMSEPMVPYNVDLYSAGYPRGNDVTKEQYLANAYTKNDTRMSNCIHFSLTPNIIFHKPNVPLFCNGSNAVTITVTTDKEKKWLYKTLWSKQFLETEDSIIHLSEDPEHCNFNSLETVLTFKNNFKFSASEKNELYDRYVLNNHTNTWYFDPDRFQSFDTSNNINNIFVELDEILVGDKFINAISRIFNTFELGDPNISLISDLYSIWQSRQHRYDD